MVGRPASALEVKAMKLLRAGGLTNEEIAIVTNRSKEFVSRKLRALETKQASTHEQTYLAEILLQDCTLIRPEEKDLQSQALLGYTHRGTLTRLLLKNFVLVPRAKYEGDLEGPGLLQFSVATVELFPEDFRSSSLGPLKD